MHLVRTLTKEDDPKLPVTIRLSRDAGPTHWRLTSYRHRQSLNTRGSLKYKEQTVPGTPGVIVGSDHGREIWNWRVNLKTVVYDEPAMLDIIRTNCSMNSYPCPELVSIHDFIPGYTPWLKIVANERTQEFIHKHWEWIGCIPEVLVELHMKPDPFRGRYKTYS